MFIFIAIITLILLIIIHELGHFLAAKKLGVKVEEFGLGYPPRIWGKQVGETLYSINLLPFGGFVKIYGQEQSIKDPESFSEKPFWKKSIIILGGVFSFWIVSVVLISIVMLLGAPSEVPDEQVVQNPKVQIIMVQNDSPASKAGLQVGDAIKKIDEVEINKVGQVQNLSQINRGKEINIEVQRGDKTFNVSLVPRMEGDGPIGIALTRTALIKYPWYLAIWKGIEGTINLTWAIIYGWWTLLSNIFTGKGIPAGMEVAGPVKIYQFFSQAGAMGINYFLQFIAFFAVNLALINSLPIPALDGGWFMFLVIEKIRKKPLNEKIVQGVSAFFFILLLALMIWITTREVIQLF